MWSAGVVLFAMLYGNVPFKGADMKDLHKQIIDANYELKDEISAGKLNIQLTLLYRGKRPYQGFADKKPQKETNRRSGPQASLAR